MKNKIEINVENYKAISKIHLSLHSKTKNKIIAIIGDNNNGKSSFLSALKKLANNPNTNKDEFTTYYDGKKEQYENSKVHPKISVKFNFSTNKEVLEIESYVIDNIFIAPNFQSYWVKKREKNIKTKIEELESTGDYKKSGAFIYYPRTFIDEKWFYAFKTCISENTRDKEILSLVDEIKKLTNYQKMSNKINLYDIKNINIFKYSVLKLNLLFEKENAQSDQLDEIRTIEIWEKILKVSFSELLTERAKKEKINKKGLIDRFEKRANNLLDNLSKDIFNKKMNQKLRIWFEAEDSTLNVVWKPLVLNKKIIQSSKIEKTGDGIKHFWSIIFRIHTINKYEPSIILLDEPEKHLNPMQQNALLKYFKEITAKKSQRDNQILLYTTHSPFMIDLDIYQNIFELYREKSNEGIFVRKIYDTKGQKTPNLLLDKNSTLRFVESLHLVNRPKKAIFLEGISDFYVLNNFLNLKDIKDVLLIPMFGNEYKKVMSYHLPYLVSYIESKNIKVIVDNDKQGKEMINWLNEETNINKENIKTYQDFFDGASLEEAILDPWFTKNNEKTNDKKINSIIFNKENRKIESYQKLIDFIEC